MGNARFLLFVNTDDAAHIRNQSIHGVLMHGYHSGLVLPAARTGLPTGKDFPAKILNILQGHRYSLLLGGPPIEHYGYESYFFLVISKYMR